MTKTGNCRPLSVLSETVLPQLLCTLDYHVTICGPLTWLLPKHVYAFFVGGRDGAARTQRLRHGLDSCGHRIPVRVRFFVSPRPELRPIHPHIQWVRCLSRGQSGRRVVVTIHLFLLPGCEWVGAVTPPTLRACVGMSRGDLCHPHFTLHLYLIHPYNAS